MHDVVHCLKTNADFVPQKCIGIWDYVLIWPQRRVEERVGGCSRASSTERLFHSVTCENVKTFFATE